MNLDLTQDEMDDKDIRPTPHWIDHCEHPPESFVCSFTIVRPFKPQVIGASLEYKVSHYDLYLYPTELHGVDVCIRYGNECSEYISPGSLFQFLLTTGYTQGRAAEYEKAANIIKDYIKPTGLTTIYWTHKHQQRHNEAI